MPLSRTDKLAMGLDLPHPIRAEGVAPLLPARPLWDTPPQLGQLSLRAQVKSLRTQVKFTQARNGMYVKCTGRAHEWH